MKIVILCSIMFIFSNINLYANIDERIILNFRNSNYANLEVHIKNYKIDKFTTYLFYGKIDLTTGKYKSAEKKLKRAYKSKKDNIIVISEYLLKTFEINKEYKQYFFTLESVLEKNINERNLSDALKNIDIIIYLNPTNIEFRLLKAYLLLKLNSPLSSIKECLEILNLKPILSDTDLFNTIKENILFAYSKLDNYIYVDIPDDLKNINDVELPLIISFIKAKQNQKAALEFIKIFKDTLLPEEFKKLLYEDLCRISFIKQDLDAEDIDNEGFRYFDNNM